MARSESSLDAVAKEINAINSAIRVLAIPTDLTNSDSVTKMWEKVKNEFGHADVLVNNAGTLTDTAAIKDADPGKWWYDFVSFNTKHSELAVLTFQCRKSTFKAPSS